MALKGSKWEIQVGDVAVLAPFALTLSQQDWARLASLAESLSRELMAAEHQLTRSPSLWGSLGLERGVRRALEVDLPWTPAAARVVRYDFHPCEDGLYISEVNSDVPGGYNEGSTLSELMARNWRGLSLAGDPMASLCDALVRSAGSTRRIALLSAPGYTEDLQVVSGLASALRPRGLEAIRCRPDQIRWREGYASIAASAGNASLGAIFRFFQGEWAQRMRSMDWGLLFKGGLTPVTNPGVAVLTESKRLPLIWPQLQTSMPTWSALLPRTIDARMPAFTNDAAWVFKPAYCNTGDTVVSQAWSSPQILSPTRLSAVLRPNRWVAQRRFAPLALDTPQGPVFPCLGVFTVNGEAAGLYGRISPHPVIDYSARDVAVLIRD